MEKRTYYYEDEYEREIFSMLEESYDLNRFLLCAPLSTDPILNYGGVLSKRKRDAFLSKLYVEGKRHVEEDIVHEICSGGKSTVKIIGNKGCGKTTLVHKLSTLLENKNHRSLILDFGDQHATLKYNFAIDSVVQIIYERLLNDLQNNNCKAMFWMADVYCKIESLVDRKWDANHKIDNVFREIEDLLNFTQNKGCSIKSVRDKLYELELYQLILMFLLTDIHENLENKRTAIFLDNLDNMIDHGDIREILRQYNNFLNGVGSLYEKIRNALGIDYEYRYVFVFVLRDSTNSYLSRHEYAIRQITEKEYDVRKHYSKKEIALKRLNLFSKYTDIYYKGDPSRKANNRKTIELLKNILSDPYVTDTIFDIFNNDYRISMMTMIKIASSGQLVNEDYNEIKNSGAMHGARGIIYRLLFNNFYKKGYFKRIRITDFQNRGIEPSSPSRLLLTYIANSTDLELTHDSRVVSLDDLLDDIHGKIDNSDVVRCLWEMYNLVTADDWCNLISFAESNDASENGLVKEYNNYLARKRGEEFNKIEYSTFRITTAGMAFLKYACVHFEFFACRSLSANYPSLFLPKAFKEDDDYEYVFKRIINAVFEEVETCAANLAKTYESDTGLCNASNSSFVYKRQGKSAQFHVERMIFSHIQYLDEFRRFALKTKDRNLAVTVSDFVLEVIENYLDMLNSDMVRCSKYGEEVVLKQLFALLEDAKSDPYNPEKEIGN